LPLAAFLAVVAAVPAVSPNAYALNVLGFIGINVLLATGLNLLMGYAGQVSLGHAGFWGLATAVTQVRNDFSSVQTYDSVSPG